MASARVPQAAAAAVPAVGPFIKSPIDCDPTRPNVPDDESEVRRPRFLLEPSANVWPSRLAGRWLAVLAAAEAGGVGQLAADQRPDLRLLVGGVGQAERAAGTAGMKQRLQLRGEIGRPAAAIGVDVDAGIGG